MRVVVPFLQSAEGSAALKAAEAEVRLRGATLVVVGHVRSEDSRAGGMVANLRERLDAYGRLLDARQIAHEAVWSVGVDTLSSAILRAAREGETALIVVGIRRRSPVGKVVLGSYQQEVLLQAPCAVLAVKAEEE